MLKTLYLKKINLKEEVVENSFCPDLKYFFMKWASVMGVFGAALIFLYLAH